MARTKRIVLDRYEHSLLVRALYETWKQMTTDGASAETIEDLILKVIDARETGPLERLFI